MKSKIKPVILVALFVTAGISACGQSKPKSNPENKTTMNNDITKPDSATATFGAGCFWCVEAVFQQLEGVDTVISGYCGGNVPNPTYREVCYGNTGHAEVCRIVYNPQKITYNDLLQALFLSHDPTTLNQQGADKGTQYRSVIFYHNDVQKAQAEKVIADLTAAKVFDSPIVTEVSPLQTFYVAEDYHQNYYNLNGEEGYCRVVIKPKLEKFRKVFAHKLKQKTTQ
jgi:peptide-methionine (S)-S-oxide reductase